MIDETIDSWHAYLDQEELTLLNGWSNDWLSFEWLDHWIIPTPRWGLKDQAFSAEHQLNTRLQF